jgi:hypothetical protein
MCASTFKSIAGSFTALALGALVATTPAAARGVSFGGGGFHSSFGGREFHGGFAGRRFHDGFGGRAFFGGFDDCYGGYGYGGYDSCIAYRAAYDRSGRVIGQAPVNIC